MAWNLERQTRGGLPFAFGEMTWKYLIEGPWIVFVAYWAVGALKTRRTERTESFASRYGILFLEIVGFALVFMDETEFGILGRRIIPRTYALGVTGVALTWSGIALALWAPVRIAALQAPLGEAQEA